MINDAASGTMIVPGKERGVTDDTFATACDGRGF